MFIFVVKQFQSVNSKNRTIIYISASPPPTHNTTLYSLLSTLYSLLSLPPPPHIPPKKKREIKMPLFLSPLPAFGNKKRLTQIFASRKPLSNQRGYLTTNVRQPLFLFILSRLLTLLLHPSRYIQHRCDGCRARHCGRTSQPSRSRQQHCRFPLPLLHYKYNYLDSSHTCC